MPRCTGGGKRTGPESTKGQHVGPTEWQVYTKAKEVSGFQGDTLSLQSEMPRGGSTEAHSTRCMLPCPSFRRHIIGQVFIPVTKYLRKLDCRQKSLILVMALKVHRPRAGGPTG